MFKISTIINYCSNDYRFIKPVIDQALEFSKQVIVPVCDSFFDGSAENRYVLNKTYKDNPRAIFIEYPFMMKYRQKYGPNIPHNISRWVGFQYLDKDVNAVLFLDSDELVEGDKFKHWLTTTGLEEYDAFRFLTQWYFRDIKYRRKMYGRTVVMAKTTSIINTKLFTKKERLGLLKGNILGRIIGPNGEPMIHHFSWVRTKQEMLKKVRTWGHCGDRKWEDFVNKEFSRPFNGVEFVRGQPCEIVVPPIKLTIPMSKENPVINKKIKRYNADNIIYLERDKFSTNLSKAVEEKV